MKKQLKKKKEREAKKKKKMQKNAKKVHFSDAPTAVRPVLTEVSERETDHNSSDDIVSYN